LIPSHSKAELQESYYHISYYIEKKHCSYLNFFEECLIEQDTEKGADKANKEYHCENEFADPYNIKYKEKEEILETWIR